ncbi:MAG TPA: hypothetical protein VGS23_02330 [Thermoplasmata archaeon]|nr:hypothetical protein [Thermoplasmata archaeon]
MIERWAGWFCVIASAFQRDPERAELHRLGEELLRLGVHPAEATSR